MEIPGKHLKRYGLRAMQGALLGCGAPLGWALIQLLRGVSPLEDFLRDPGVYLYMLIGTTLAFTAFGFYVGRHEQRFEDYALVDELTGLYNARLFHRRLQEDLSAADRLRFPLSLVIVDLDHFKAVNDQHGHLAGDVVLRAVARHLSSGQRQGDTVARIGGEEFAVILPFTTASAAASIADRLREGLAHLPIRLPSGHAISITASFGVSAFRSGGGERADTLFQRADNAMYEAKQHGRNRVVNFDALPERAEPAARGRIVALPPRASANLHDDSRREQK